jgi:dTDP-glucose 4,6-dehydratase
MKILVTGGSGFIGSNFIEYFANHYTDIEIINIDILTYAANKSNNDIAAEILGKKYTFEEADICDFPEINSVFAFYKPDYVVHFAAESSVDKSLLGDSESQFIVTNVEGTLNIFKAARSNNVKRTLYISTDEVYGDILKGSATEDSLLNPRNLYAASKLAGEHIAKSYFHTYNMDIVITRSSNNYGKYQHAEKFIPASIQNLLLDKPITLYGDGSQKRQWIHVVDNCRGIAEVLFNGKKAKSII